jgi:hypothetical protein
MKSLKNVRQRVYFFFRDRGYKALDAWRLAGSEHGKCIMKLELNSTFGKFRV